MRDETRSLWDRFTQQDRINNERWVALEGELKGYQHGWVAASLMRPDDKAEKEEPAVV